jgi:hypothetical protein
MSEQSGEIIWPTDEEDAAILAAALSDPDALPMTDAEWEQVCRENGFDQGPGLTEADIAKALRKRPDGTVVLSLAALRENARTP